MSFYWYSFLQLCVLTKKWWAWWDRPWSIEGIAKWEISEGTIVYIHNNKTIRWCQFEGRPCKHLVEVLRLFRIMLEKCKENRKLKKQKQKIQEYYLTMLQSLYVSTFIYIKLLLSTPFPLWPSTKKPYSSLHPIFQKVKNETLFVHQTPAAPPQL